jgi:glucan phosphoethanolaminetransferase (alkaline phosphatase superfamily)
LNERRKIFILKIISNRWVGMVTTYAFISVLCLVGNLYFIWRVLSKNLNYWIVPLLLLIVSYFSSSFTYVEAIRSLSSMNETNTNEYAAVVSFLSLNNYLLTLNVLVFVLYIIVAIIMKAVVKTETKKQV